MTIAFLGTGRMGTELALHLLKSHDVVVWNRTPERTARVQDAGARVASSVAVEPLSRSSSVSLSFQFMRFGVDVLAERK